MDDHLIESEHAVQIGMIDLLSTAVNNNESDNDKRRVLEQLISYTDVHFMSEQLVMRQYSYDGFDAHDAEHSQIMDHLMDIKERVEKDPSTMDAQTLQSLRGMILSHIASEDRQLHRFLRHTS